MSENTHEAAKYSFRLVKYGEHDPSSRHPFRNDEDVVICHNTKSLISRQSLIENNYFCPLCSSQLTSNLIFENKIDNAPRGKYVPPKPIPASRQNSRSPMFWGGAVVTMLICFVAAASGLTTIFTNPEPTSNPPITRTSIRPSATQPTKKPITTNTSIPRKTPTKTTQRITPSATKQVSSNSSSCSEISSISVSDTSKGDILKIKCTNGSTYEMPPLAKGTHAIGPNKKFFVYASNDGNVYIAKSGNKILTLLDNFKEFDVIRRNGPPNLTLSFNNISPYTLTIYEKTGRQRKNISIPRRFSE